MGTGMGLALLEEVIPRGLDSQENRLYRITQGTIRKVRLRGQLYEWTGI